MKKVLVILLTAFMLGGSMHLEEMIRIPFLAVHFTEHCAQHPSDTFLAFLYKHYLLNQIPESVQDKSSDSKLPFKSNHAVQAHFAVFTVPCSYSPHVFIKYKKLAFYYCEAKVLSPSFDIWQPPRVG